MNFKTFSLVAVAVLTGCNNETKLEPLPRAPTISAFKASMTVAPKGGKVMLEWATADAVTVEIHQVGTGALAGVDNKGTGSVEATIKGDSLFVLSAINSRGAKATALVTVGVEGGSAQASFFALPSTIPAGGAATLVWNAPAAKTITITPAGGTALDLKMQGDLGSVEVKPAATTVYTLNADGTTKTVTVAVTQAIASFTASKTLALPGDTITLTWKTSGASKITVTTPGKPALATQTDPTKTADGSVMAVLPNLPLGSVVPFTLEVEGAGTVQKVVVGVTLSKNPLIKTFTAPEYARVGSKFSLAWTTENADLVELSTGGVVFWSSTLPGQATSGSLLLEAPTAATTYTLTAKSALGVGEVTKTVSINPVGVVSITTFTATPAVVPAGGSAVTLTWNVPSARRVRITGSDGHTVATATGPTAETGTAMAFPNKAITYTLDADNTLDAPVTATQAVTVTAPTQFGPATNAPVFAGNPVSIDWTVGGGSAQLVGYPHADFVANAASTGFTDISATGKKLTFAAAANDATLTFTPPDFESFLYGARVTGPVTVSTNGFFVFAASAASRATTLALPNTTIERNFVAPLWADLALGPNGQVFWQVLNEAPERTLVVQFDRVQLVSEATSELTFQAKVHQTGVVTFEYKQITAMTLPTVVQGVQGISGGLAVAGLANTSSLTLYGPKVAPLSATFLTAAPVGGFIKLVNGYLKAEYAPPQFIGQGSVSITEVLYQPSAAIATTGEWFEVKNSTSLPLDLNGWTIDFGGGPMHTLTTAVSVPANGSIVLGQSAAGPLNDNVATQYQYGTTFSMAEPSGSVKLSTGSFSAISSWNSATADNGGEGVSVGVDTGLYLKSTDLSTTPPHGLSCSSTVSFGTQTPQQKGTPGTSGNCFGYAAQSIPVRFHDIAATATVTVTGDSNVATVDLSSAPFPYFGGPRTSMVVSSNGFVVFKPTTDSGTGNRTLPNMTSSISGTLAIFWDDLDSNAATPNSNVYAKRIAANEDPNTPAAHWLIQWSHYRHWLVADDLNFEIMLFDDGAIEYHYGSMVSGSTLNYGNGNSATVWLENYLSNTAMVFGVNQPVVTPFSAIRFTPN